MACRSLLNCARRAVPQGIQQMSTPHTWPRILTCYSTINRHPEMTSMVGVRYATQAKLARGAPKPKPVPGYRVGVTKGFDSQHTGSLKGSYGASDRLLDDIMLRKYVDGVFYDHLESDIVIKRRDNRIIIAFIANRESDINKIYFLTAFSEKLLSEVFGCIVKFEPQTGL